MTIGVVLSCEDSRVAAECWLAAARDVYAARRAATTEERQALLARAERRRDNARWFTDHARRV